MKKIKIQLNLIVAVLLFTGFTAMAQTAASSDASKTTNAKIMKSYLIERDIPGAGKLNAAELKGIAKTSCNVLKEMGPSIEWIQSYVAGDKIYCIYKAENADLIREHAKKGGFPANSIVEISAVISPETAK